MKALENWRPFKYKSIVDKNVFNLEVKMHFVFGERLDFFYSFKICYLNFVYIRFFQFYLLKFLV